MAKKPATGGVIPGKVNVPTTKAKTPAPKQNGAAMPQGVINPFVNVGKGKK